MVLNWLKNYIGNRQQFVQIGEHKSNFSNITCGVPQGSVLGPVLFTLYINDICKVLDRLKFVLFADDTNILCSGGDLQQLLKVITTEMGKLKNWFDINKLSLNLNKTKFMLLGSKKANTQVQIKIENVDIERVYENKFLGVILDHKICWKPHIKHVQSKLARSIAVLGKSRHLLNHKALSILYCSLILPYRVTVQKFGATHTKAIYSLYALSKKKQLE